MPARWVQMAAREEIGAGFEPSSMGLGGYEHMRLCAREQIRTLAFFAGGASVGNGSISSASRVRQNLTEIQGKEHILVCECVYGRSNLVWGSRCLDGLLRRKGYKAC